MIYYPLSVLMLASIQDILISTTQEDSESFNRLLGDGKQFGVNLSYTVQPSPNGLAQAFIIGEEFIGNESVCLVLGDNIFHGYSLTEKLLMLRSGKWVQQCFVAMWQIQSVLVLLSLMKAISIEEKPTKPKSNYCVTGLYFYDNNVVDVAKNIKPSTRGELEFTCVNNEYLMRGHLNVELLGRGHAWLDTGTHESLLEAGHFVQIIEHRQGLKVTCLEKIAFNNGWLSKAKLLEQGKALAKTGYGQYLLKIVGQ